MVYLEAERATLGAREQQIEAEAAHVRHVAGTHSDEPAGAETESERTIRWLLALIMLCCEASVGALTAVPHSNAALPKVMYDVAPLRRRASTAQLQSEPSPSPDERRVPRHGGDLRAVR